MNLIDLFETQETNRWYHSSPQQYDIAHSLPFTHFGTHKAAVRRLMEQGRLTPDNHVHGYMYSVQLNLSGKSLRLRDGGDNIWDKPYKLMDKLAYAKKPVITMDERRALSVDFYDDGEDYSMVKARDALAKLLMSKGITHFIYKNTKEDIWQDSVMILSNQLISDPKVEKIDTPYPELWEYVRSAG